ncbi:MAG: hypothetical protein AAGF44_01605 [Pseudomonadota bacterium]
MKHLFALAMALCLAQPALAADEPDIEAPPAAFEEIERVESLLRDGGFLVDRQDGRLRVRSSAPQSEGQVLFFQLSLTQYDIDNACLARFAASNTSDKPYFTKTVIFCQRPDYDPTPGAVRNTIQMNIYDGSTLEERITYGQKCTFMQYIDFAIFTKLCGLALPEL